MFGIFNKAKDFLKNRINNVLGTAGSLTNNIINDTQQKATESVIGLAQKAQDSFTNVVTGVKQQALDAAKNIAIREAAALFQGAQDGLDIAAKQAKTNLMAAAKENAKKYSKQSTSFLSKALSLFSISTEDTKKESKNISAKVFNFIMNTSKSLISVLGSSKSDFLSLINDSLALFVTAFIKVLFPSMSFDEIKENTNKEICACINPTMATSNSITSSVLQPNDASMEIWEGRNIFDHDMVEQFEKEAKSSLRI